MSLIINGSSGHSCCPWPKTIHCTSIYQTSTEEILIPVVNYSGVESRLVFLINDVDIIADKKVSVKIFIKHIAENIPVYKNATTQATGEDFVPGVPKLLWFDKENKKFYFV